MDSSLTALAAIAVVAVVAAVWLDRRRRRAEVLVRQRHLDETCEREAAERLRDLDRMKSEFLQTVSHELRTPLTVILGIADTLERGDLDASTETMRDLVARIAANARRLDRLMADVLDLDRLARGTLQVRRRPTRMDALLSTVLAAVDLGGRPVSAEGASVVALVDPAQVERIVENLLVNAAKHTPAGTPVWVRVEEESEGVLLTVEDAGPGVPDELKEAIFEPFRRSAADAPGTGIGLSLVARLAELHGGRAWVQDRPGGGASFRVSLPGWPRREHRARVLVVDWDGSVDWAEAEILRRAGYDVAICGGPAHPWAASTCPLVERGRCALVSGADAVAFGLTHPTPEAIEVARAYRGHAPGTPMVLEVPAAETARYGRLFEGCDVVAAPVTADRMVGLLGEMLARSR
ncbi:MAG: HAMP domain-containing histidine kinase [Acidobacteria bacterium]|nr:HAMP domain-containing histidine kinase [Acidobacteriota bacterium]